MNRRLYHQRDYIFTYLLLNVVTFFLAFLLSKSPIGLGSAFGLFAVFGILRYRTEGIQVRNLTYLFVVIGVALLNALANDQVSLGGARHGECDHRRLRLSPRSLVLLSS